MIVTALYCAGRLATARRRNRTIERDLDVMHVGMGVAMAGMLLPWLNPLAGGGWTLCWTVFFALAACWFGTKVLIAVADAGAVGHHLAHLLASGAMIYMLDGVSGMGSMSGMSGMAAGSPMVASALTLVLLVAFAVDAVLATGRVVRHGGMAIAGGGSTGIGPPLAPRLAGCCQIAMSVTMGYMLLLML
jgi:hypothetical protein